MLPGTVWSFIWQKVTEATIKWFESTHSAVCWLSCSSRGNCSFLKEYLKSCHFRIVYL